MIVQNELPLSNQHPLSLPIPTPTRLLFHVESITYTWNQLPTRGIFFLKIPWGRGTPSIQRKRLNSPLCCRRRISTAIYVRNSAGEAFLFPISIRSDAIGSRNESVPHCWCSCACVRGLELKFETNCRRKATKTPRLSSFFWVCGAPSFFTTTAAT